VTQIYKKKICSEGHERWVSYDNSSYCSTSSFDGASSILQEVYSSLEEADIVVEQVWSHFTAKKMSILLIFDIKLFTF
jgi:hypothetical protein